MNVANKTNKNPILTPIDARIVASKDLKYPSLKSHEVGWRSKIKPNLSLDLELFISNANNFVVSNAYRDVVLLSQLNQSGKVDSIKAANVNINYKFENYDVTTRQYGASFMLIYDPTNKITAKIYGTWQNSDIRGKTKPEFITSNIIVGEVTPQYILATEIQSFTNPTRWSQKLTPSFYGGFYLNYKYGNNWNFSTDAYYSSHQRFIDFDHKNTMSDYSGRYNDYYMDIKSNIVLNAKASYRINKNISSYIIIKNILGNHREFGYADQIGTLCLVGIQLRY
jgi:iron complex outermembrane receptor protein